MLGNTILLLHQIHYRDNEFTFKSQGWSPPFNKLLTSDHWDWEKFHCWKWGPKTCVWGPLRGGSIYDKTWALLPSDGAV
ncbi:hypothetical protein F2P79_009089 [Pimephales promelas]|nr:hypothetical protein F2P79_009089 [Pimephales promelas]